MEEKQTNSSIKHLIKRLYTKELEKDKLSTNDIYDDFQLKVNSIFDNRVSELFSDMLSEKILEIQKNIDENTIIKISKMLGYKINTQKLIKAEADFKLIRIMTLILKKKNFRKNLEKRLTNPNIFCGSIFKDTDDDIYIKLEELVRKAAIEELFYQVKKSEYVLDNVSFEVREQSRIKNSLSKRFKYVKGNWKGITFDIIKNVITKLIVNYIIKVQNRRIKNSCYYFVQN